MLELKIRTFKKGDAVRVISRAEKGKEGAIWCETKPLMTGSTMTRRFLVEVQEAFKRVVTVRK